MINRKKESKKLPSDFIVNNRNISNPVEIADRFCEYFTNIGPNLFNSIDISSRCFNSYLTGNMVDSLYFNLVTDIEIKEIINNLRSGISPGYDKIPMWLVKDSNEFIIRPLVHIMNLSISSGIVPDQLKVARVLPLFKPGKRVRFPTIDPSQCYQFFLKYLKRSYTNDYLTTSTNLIFYFKISMASGKGIPPPWLSIIYMIKSQLQLTTKNSPLVFFWI